MKVEFADPELEELYTLGKSRGKYKKLSRDKRITDSFIDVVATMLAATGIRDLKMFSTLHYEKLKYRPESSVRLLNGRVERLLFLETSDGVRVTLLEINSDHYGNKR